MPTQSVPPHFVVIVPGYMGSLLQDKHTHELVWLDLGQLLLDQLSNPDAVSAMLRRMNFANQDLMPAGLIKDVLIAPPLVKLEQYGRLLDSLRAWGYQIDPPHPGPEDLAAYTFSYDWRQDNRDSAGKLGAAIDTWAARQPGAKAWVIAHSNGGVVSRWYIQKEGGAARVEKLFLMGSPYDGAPENLRIFLEGLDFLGLRKLNPWDMRTGIRNAMRTFPSFYQLLPLANPFLYDANNQNINLFDNPTWLSTDEERRLLAEARRFIEDLAHPVGVEAFCYYGNRKPTSTTAVAERTPTGCFKRLKWIETGAGDGTVPVRSAINPWVDPDKQFPFPASHGDIYANPAALEFLWKELIGRYTGAVRAALYLPDFSIVFEPEKDFYSPGASAGAWAKLTDPATEAAITGATVNVRWIFRGPLPGQSARAQVPPTPWRRLRASRIAGRYAGHLPAPDFEGYYALQAWVRAKDKPAVSLEELVLIEAPEPVSPSQKPQARTR